MTKVTNDRKLRRKRRVSSQIRGTVARPRISVFRSNVHIYAQAVDDINRVTLASYSTVLLNKKGTSSKKKSEDAHEVGVTLAQSLKEKQIEHAVFDRGAYAYNGRVKSLAEGLRKGGLIV